MNDQDVNRKEHSSNGSDCQARSKVICEDYAIDRAIYQRGDEK